MVKCYKKFKTITLTTALAVLYILSLIPATPVHAAVVPYMIGTSMHLDYDDVTNTLSVYSDKDGEALNYDPTVMSQIATDLAVASPVTVEIDWSVGNIGNNVFKGATYMNGLVVNGNSNANKTVGTSAFEGCVNLSTVTLNGVTSIGARAFCGDTAISSVSIPKVATIGQSAFEGCQSLSSLSLPSVTQIAAKAFKNNSSLSTINDATAVASIDPSAFQVSASSPVVTTLGSGVSQALKSYDWASANRTLYLSEFTLTFVKNNGEQDESIKVANGSLAKVPTPAKPHCTLEGWYSEPDFQNKVEFTSGITADGTFYAKWTKPMYTAAFNTNGGSAVEAQSLEQGAKVKMPDPAPTKSGYYFTGWYADDKCITPYNFDTQVGSDITIYAQWSAVPTYTVHFVVGKNLTEDDSEEIADQKVFDKGKVTEPKAPSREGYTFKGWYKDNNYKKKWSFDSDVVTQDTTLWGKMLSNKITVSWDTGINGLSLASTTIDRGQPIKQPQAPTAEDREFEGWYFNDEKWDFGTVPTEEKMTLTARWKWTSFTITFESNGGTPVTPAKVTNGGKCPKPVDPTKEGYTFAGWYTDAALTNPANFDANIGGSSKLYAKWIQGTLPIPTLTAIPSVTPEQLKEIAKANGIKIPATGDNSIVPEFLFHLFK